MPTQDALLANVTAVAVGSRGVLIEGPPGSGKSSLALSLIDRGATLIGDDGVVLQNRSDQLWGSPPPRITGKLEVRGVGVFEVESTAAQLCLLLSLTAHAPRLPEARMHTFHGIALPAIPFQPGDANQALRAEWALSRFGLT